MMLMFSSHLEATTMVLYAAKNLPGIHKSLQIIATNIVVYSNIPNNSIKILVTLQLLIGHKDYIYFQDLLSTGTKIIFKILNEATKRYTYVKTN